MNDFPEAFACINKDKTYDVLCQLERMRAGSQIQKID